MRGGTRIIIDLDAVDMRSNGMIDSESPPARQCGTCTLCCKVLSITELNKPQGVWCAHCKPGVGCSVYAERPAECRSFHCGYLMWPMAGPHWVPTKSKMVLVAELEETRVAVHVDPGWPNAWRANPYYADLKRWSHLASQQTNQVVVMIRRRAIVIFPNRDVDLGVISDDDRIITLERRSSEGLELEAHKVRADDPRLAGMKPGAPFRLPYAS